MAQETENKIIPYSQHYLCSSELLGNKYQADKIFQYLFDRFLCNYRSNNRDTGMFLFSKQKIEQSTGVERHTVSKGLKRLMDLGLITIEGNSCIVYYSYYNAIIRLFSFANSDDKTAIKNAFDSCDKKELERLGGVLNDENIDNEIATLSKGGINIPSMVKSYQDGKKLPSMVENYHDGKKLPSMVKSCQHGKKLPSMVENYHDGNFLPCFDEDFWNNFTTMVKNYHDGKKLPYDSESFSSSLLDMVKSCHAEVNSSDIQALLVQLGIDVMVKSCQAYGKKLPNTPDFMATFYHSNINKEINKENKYERSEYIEGENKEKVEVGEELEDNGELPVDLNNSYNSFLGNSLGESSSNNQETSSDKNILDSEPLMETSQEEEIKVQEIPDWKETRDSSYPSFPAMEINNMIRYPRDYQEDIHELIRRTFELFEGDACQEYEEETSQIPCRFFDRELKEIVEELKEGNPEFSISFQDAKNIFFFEPVWNGENKEFDYEISTSSIHDITQAPRKAGKNRKSSDTKFTSIERYSYWEALDEVGDGDEKNLTPMEQAVYALKYDMEVDETRHSILGTSSDGQNYLFVKSLYDQQVVKWAEEAEVDVEEFKELLKVFKKQNNKVVIRPTRIDIGKIMDWNRQHSLESKVEILWKQKMAEPQD